MKKQQKITGNTKKGIKRSVRLVWIGFFSSLLLLVGMLVATNYGLFGKMPSLEEIQNPTASEASEVYSDNGTSMGKFYLEDRSPVDIKMISPNVIKALIATEDERFYEHSGIDGRSMLRAISGVVTLDSKGGASTITQQLALNMFGGKRATNIVERIMQKIKEMIIAVKLERNFTKDEIISYYLNTVSFGENVFGIRNAARTFFQKETIDLTVDESAVLVGILKANTTYNPRRYPEASRNRRNVVIDQMLRNNFVSVAEAEKLKAKPLGLNYKKIEYSDGLAPHFRESTLKDEVKRLLKDKVKLNGQPYNIYRDGLRIYTTIDLDMQKAAEDAMVKAMIANQNIFNQFGFVKSGSIFNNRQKELEKFMKQSDRWRFQKEEGLSDAANKATFYKKVKMNIFAWKGKNFRKDTTMTPMDSIKYLKTHLQSGFIAMEPQTGHIKAWVGGYDFKTFKIDHANLNMKRQVGSTIKPLLYSQAVEEAGFGPETMVEDRQQFFPGNGMVPATGKGTSGGSMAMAQALARSKNGAAAYLMKQLGPVRFVDFLNRCKVQTKVAPFPSIALGSCDLSLYEMIWMYSMFPGRGFNIRPQIITRIEDRNGNVLVSITPEITEVISEVTAYTMAKMMMGAVQFGTATRLKNYGLKVEVSAKTGTTNDNTDAWFMAYTPELLCGNWVGCDENWIHFPSRSGAGYGGAAALPMVGEFLKTVYNNKKLGYNPEAKFIKPVVDKNDMIYDYFENLNYDTSPDAAGQDMGAGTEEQYMDDLLNEEVYEQVLPDNSKQKALEDSIAAVRRADSLKKAAEGQKPKAVLVPVEPEEKKTRRELRREAREKRKAGEQE
ncbi:MAG: transglycosylase domain-containing protein [Chitinophagaceae bacterium]|nr:transglycosylase domain-containing protein [Chitinophagaceae bacterium]